MRATPANKEVVSEWEEKGTLVYDQVFRKGNVIAVIFSLRCIMPEIKPEIAESKASMTIARHNRKQLFEKLNRI